MSLLVLLFWISTILLALAAFAGFAFPADVRWPRAAFVLVVIDLALLGWRVMPH